MKCKLCNYQTTPENTPKKLYICNNCKNNLKTWFSKKQLKELGGEND